MMGKVDNFGSGSAAMVVVEDRPGSELAVEFDRLPHVQAALEGLRTNPSKRDELHRKLSVEMTRRGTGDRPE